MLEPINWRARIGLITTSGQLITESRFPYLAPSGVTFHVTRMMNAGGGMAALIEMEKQSWRAVEELSTARVTSLGYCCTVSGALRGLQGDIDFCHEVEQRYGIPTTSTMLAAVEALKTLGLKRIVVTSPYHTVDLLDLTPAQWAFIQAQIDIDVSRAEPWEAGAAAWLEEQEAAYDASVAERDSWLASLRDADVPDWIVDAAADGRTDALDAWIARQHRQFVKQLRDDGVDKWRIDAYEDGDAGPVENWYAVRAEQARIQEVAAIDYMRKHDYPQIVIAAAERGDWSQAQQWEQMLLEGAAHQMGNALVDLRKQGYSERAIAAFAAGDDSLVHREYIDALALAHRPDVVPPEAESFRAPESFPTSADEVQAFLGRQVHHADWEFPYEEHTALRRRLSELQAVRFQTPAHADEERMVRAQIRGIELRSQMVNHGVGHGPGTYQVAPSDDPPGYRVPLLSRVADWPVTERVLDYFGRWGGAFIGTALTGTGPQQPGWFTREDAYDLGYDVGRGFTPVFGVVEDAEYRGRDGMQWNDWAILGPSAFLDATLVGGPLARGALAFKPGYISRFNRRVLRLSDPDVRERVARQLALYGRTDVDDVQDLGAFDEWLRYENPGRSFITHTSPFGDVLTDPAAFARAQSAGALPPTAVFGQVGQAGLYNVPGSIPSLRFALTNSRGLPGTRPTVFIQSVDDVMDHTGFRVWDSDEVVPWSSSQRPDTFKGTYEVELPQLAGEQVRPTRSIGRVWRDFTPQPIRAVEHGLRRVLDRFGPRRSRKAEFVRELIAHDYGPGGGFRNRPIDVRLDTSAVAPGYWQTVAANLGLGPRGLRRLGFPIDRRRLARISPPPGGGSVDELYPGLRRWWDDVDVGGRRLSLPRRSALRLWGERSIRPVDVSGGRVDGLQGRGRAIVSAPTRQGGPVRPGDVARPPGRLDGRGFLGRVDLPRRHGRVDVPTFAGRVDVPTFAGRVDVPDFPGRVDVPDFPGRVDVPDFPGRVDVPDFPGRVDVPDFPGRVDVPTFPGRVDVPTFPGRLDPPTYPGRLRPPTTPTRLPPPTTRRTGRPVDKRETSTSSVRRRTRRPDDPAPPASGRPVGPVVQFNDRGFTRTVDLGARTEVSKWTGRKGRPRDTFKVLRPRPGFRPEPMVIRGVRVDHRSAFRIKRWR